MAMTVNKRLMAMCMMPYPAQRETSQDRNPGPAISLPSAGASVNASPFPSPGPLDLPALATAPLQSRPGGTTPETPLAAGADRQTVNRIRLFRRSPMNVTGILETALHVESLERAIDFYRRVFGFEVMAQDRRFCAFNVAGRDVLLLFKRD